MPTITCRAAQLVVNVNGSSEGSFYLRVLQSHSGDVAIINRANEQALHWTAAQGAVPLTELMGVSAEVSVNLVSDDGEVLFGSAREAGEEGARAFRWSELDGVEWLGTLSDAPANSVYSLTHASRDGAVAVGRVRRPLETEGVYRNEGAFRWSRATGVQRLDPTLTRETTTYVSPSGDTIAGYYWSDDGQNYGFRWNEQTGLIEMPAMVRETDVALDADLIVYHTSGGPRALKFAPGLAAGERLPIDLMLSTLVPAGWQSARIKNIAAHGTALVGTAMDPSEKMQAYLVRVQRRCR